MDRILVPEQMDDPALAPALHREALRELSRINRASSIAKQLLTATIKFSPGKSVKLLDVASGGGDVPIEFSRRARNLGIDIDLTLMDISDIGLSVARSVAQREGLSLTTRVGDVLQPWSGETFDVVTCSLFLHHLTRPQVVRAFENFQGMTGKLLLVNDLRRCVGGIVAAHVACRWLSSSPVVQFDGPVSARAAWTMDELRAMAEEAGLSGAVVRRAWPFRMMLRWEKQ